MLSRRRAADEPATPAAPAAATPAASETATPAAPAATTPAATETATPAATETAKPAATETAKPAAAEAGLIAWWKFDEGGGTTVKDSAGKNDGKITGAKWVDGKIGKALDFDGQGAYVEIPNAPALNLTKAITMEAWVKHRGNTIYTWETILAKGDSAYRLHFDETDQAFGMGLTDENGFWNLSSTVKPDPDKWYFVVATFDGKEAALYVNGKKTVSATDVPTTIAIDDYGVCIGDNNEATGRYFNGIIDEVKLYDRALSADEVAKQYAAASETAEAGLVASWAFNEGEGTTAKDSAGKNNGKIVGAKWVDGKVGKALDFDGQGAYVEVPNAPALNLTKAITMEAWVKHRGADIYTWETILAKGDSAYRLHFDEMDQSFGMGLTDENGFWNLSSTVKPDPDKWYFVVATFDGKEAVLYVNGKKMVSATDIPTTIATNDYGVCIGENNEATGRFFNGIIDEVKLYDRALSADEVAKQYEAVK